MALAKMPAEASTDSYVEMPRDLQARLQAYGIKHARVIEGRTRFDW